MERDRFLHSEIGCRLDSAGLLQGPAAGGGSNAPRVYNDGSPARWTCSVGGFFVQVGFPGSVISHPFTMRAMSLLACLFTASLVLARSPQHAGEAGKKAAKLAPRKLQSQPAQNVFSSYQTNRRHPSAKASSRPLHHVDMARVADHPQSLLSMEQPFQTCPCVESPTHPKSIRPR